MTFVLRLVLLFAALSLDIAFALAPTITAPLGTGKPNGEATLSANITAGGAATTVTFSYGLTGPAYGSSATVQVVATAVNQPTSADLTGLSKGQTYHFKIDATNADGTATTGDLTFFEPAAIVTTGAATTVAATATLSGAVTANGFAGQAHFEYGLTTTYGSVTPNFTVLANAVNEAIEAVVMGLTRNTTYHFRLVFVDDATSTQVNGADAQFITNNAPVANTDTVASAGAGPTTIHPLVNDRDPDGDAITLVGVATQSEHGTAVKNGDDVVYTPDAGFAGFDTFTYTVEDVYGLDAEGTINIRSARGALSGTHGGFIKRANGKEVGYFTVNALSTGSFSGIAIIEGKRYVVFGTISRDGVYRGFARDGHSAIPVFIFVDQNDTDSSVTALFDNGRWSSNLTLSPDDRTTRKALFGRYTAGFGAGGAGPTDGNDPGTAPEGTGWVAVRVRPEGSASIKGRLSDGRSFSCKGTVNLEGDVATLSFYDDPEDTRVVGLVTLGETVGGTVQTDRHSSGEGIYARGFDVTQTASGSRYIPPSDGSRALDTTTSRSREVTITFSGSDLPGTFSRDLSLDDRDRAKKIPDDPAELKLRIDRKSGRFQAKITVDTEGRRIKGTGVLIQTAGNGVGIFKTSVGTGSITISSTGSGAAPDPEPVPVPLPGPDLDPDPIVVVQ
jgi:hypothetical protein